MKHIVLYGASFTGKLAMEYFGEDNILYFCDGDINKQKQKFCDKPVIDLATLLELREKVQVVITSHKYKEITKTLIDNGFTDVSVFKIDVCRNYGCYQSIKDNMEIIRDKIESENVFCIERTIKKEDGKKKICFIYISYAYWNTNQTLFEEFVNDERFLVQILFMNSNYYDEKLMQYKNKVEMLMGGGQYQVEIEKPHLMIFNITEYWKYPDNLKADFLHSQGVKILLLHTNIMVFGNGDGYMERYLASGELWSKADLIVVQKDYYHVPNLIEMSNPKLDLIYKRLNKGISGGLYSNLYKIKTDKKIILWNIGHGIAAKDNISEFFAMDIWLGPILEAVAENNDIVLLIRPHPFVLDELIKNDIWTKMDLYHFRTYINKHDRIILDESKDYGDAFLLSDAMISDLSGLIFTYLPTYKPILYLEPLRSKYGAYDKHMLENLYHAKNKIDINNFFEMIRKGVDPLLERREETIHEYIPIFDGRGAQRLKQQIINYFHLEENN